MIAAFLVIAFSSGTQDSGAVPNAARLPTANAAPEKACTARKAVRYYAKRIAYWRHKMGAGWKQTVKPNRSSRPRSASCPRYLAHILKVKATLAKYDYYKYVEYHWHWWKWLPDKWQRIGACETGYGKRPGRWDWNSGTYQGAFGFYYGTWDQYKPKGAPSEAYLATPRQQYQCALNVAAVHGYGAWGCGGA